MKDRSCRLLDLVDTHPLVFVTYIALVLPVAVLGGLLELSALSWLWWDA